VVNYIIAAVVILSSMISHAMEDKLDPLTNLCNDSPVFVICKRMQEARVKVQLLEPDDTLTDDVNSLIDQAQDEIDKIDHSKLPQGNYYISKLGTFLKEKESPIITLDLTDFCKNITDEALDSIVETCPHLEIVKFCYRFDDARASDFQLRIPKSRGMFVPCRKHAPIFEKNYLESQDVEHPSDLFNS
jgi:hypothetical protein